MRRCRYRRGCGASLVGEVGRDGDYVNGISAEWGTLGSLRINYTPRYTPHIKL